MSVKLLHNYIFWQILNLTLYFTFTDTEKCYHYQFVTNWQYTKWVLWTVFKSNLQAIYEDWGFGENGNAWNFQKFVSAL